MITILCHFTKKQKGGTYHPWPVPPYIEFSKHFPIAKHLILFKKREENNIAQNTHRQRNASHVRVYKKIRGTGFTDSLWLFTNLTQKKGRAKKTQNHLLLIQLTSIWILKILINGFATIPLSDCKITKKSNTKLFFRWKIWVLRVIFNLFNVFIPWYNY